MNKQLLVVMDADAIIAQTNPDDALHKRTQEIASILISLNARILYPTSTLAKRLRLTFKEFLKTL